MNLGLLITAYEESRKPGRLARCLEIAADPRIGEVVIVDDASSDFAQLAAWYEEWRKTTRPELKTALHRNPENLGVFGNKLLAIHYAQSEWVQSIDSDNWITPAYLDVLEKHPHVPTRMFSPSFARPHFDYREKAGHTIRRTNLQEFQPWKRFSCLMNTGNQFFHRPTMIDVMRDQATYNNQLTQFDHFGLGEGRRDLKWRKVYDSADSFYFNQRWLLAGYEVYIVPELEYDHEVTEHSSWAAAPSEKDVLPAIYYLELQQPAAYTFERYEKYAGRRCAVLRQQTQAGRRRLWVDVDNFTVHRSLKI